MKKLHLICFTLTNIILLTNGNLQITRYPYDEISLRKKVKNFEKIASVEPNDQFNLNGNFTFTFSFCLLIHRRFYRKKNKNCCLL
jgi:hypothetical protein